MISYVAHIPHSPLLLPRIARHKARQFKKMTQSVEEISHDIYSRGCETVVVVSPYATHTPYLLNVSPQYETSFGKFGDFLTIERFYGDLEIPYLIRHGLGIEFPVASVTQPLLDSATASAMIQLHSQAKQYQLLPVYLAPSPTQNIFSFGEKLRDILSHARKKIAVVSLGDMGRTNRYNQEEGKKIDQKILSQLQQYEVDALLNHNPAEVRPFSHGCLRPLALVLGLLSGSSYKPEVLNYEQKFGVGMLAARFI